MDKSLFKNEIHQLNDGIFEVVNLTQGNYDGQAAKYDNLTSSAVYNRIMWGNSPKNYARFCQQGLQEHNGRIIADIGCGTLSFTSGVYAKKRPENLFLCDWSYDMLKVGKERLEPEIEAAEAITFLRADALDMPFNDRSIHSLFCFGFIHILEKPYLLAKELYRILHPDGKLYLTSLCNDRKLSSGYLNFLYKKGIVAKPMHSTDVVKIIKTNGFRLLECRVKGGMAYITAIR